MAFAVIVSHDCEFNEGKRNKLLLARLQSVPRNLSPEQLEDLRQSNDIETRIARGLTVAAVDSWLFASVPGAFDDEHVANFGTITPLPMKLSSELLSVKRAELAHAPRVLFRKKLAYFVGRDAEDIPETEKHLQPPQDEPLVT
jgi:hypothetical protein